MQCFVSLRLQKRRLNKVTWSTGKYPPNKLRISAIEITIQFFNCVLNLRILCALQDKLQPFGFKLSVFCSCLAAASGQQTSTAVTRLGRKGLICQQRSFTRVKFQTFSVPCLPEILKFTGAYICLHPYFMCEKITYQLWKYKIGIIIWVHCRAHLSTE